jgi:hypothetical protein
MPTPLPSLDAQSPLHQWTAGEKLPNYIRIGGDLKMPLALAGPMVSRR